ncbi:MAG: beta-ketoacyl-[acyl-carrier-protein] synthase II [Elusimicrobia bacterium RIFCSPLOWO2_01_FULL_64_13]|nr:MAG: beta-ketoacyl-[acyl-carrier-protein] synthase II [Elusimicrobia bacterium RIFCSPLOWO2_01_FULL_64_13]
MSKVVITGMGALTPIGIGLEAYWDGLMKGESGAGPVTLIDASAYPCRIAAELKGFDPLNFIEKKKIKRMDRFTQFAVAAAKMALEDSGLDLSKEDLERVGVIVGSGIGGLRTIEEEFTVLKEKGVRRVTPFLIPKLISNMAAGEIAILHGFAGPNYAVSSACATANHAIGEAMRHLRFGDADVIVCGGTEAAITQLGLSGFSQAGALAESYNDRPQKASRPFDKDREGFLMGEGAGIVILETEEHARKRGARIHAELAGYGATDDAYHITSPSPEGKAQARALRLALADAKVIPDQVDYINAHGTSTLVNDKSETLVIKNVFGERAGKIPVSSTKSMTGHLLGAAGGVELIACVLSMRNGMVHPTINYETPDPECDLDVVPNRPRKHKVTCAASNSFGFGGHNAVLVVKSYPAD